MGKNVKLIIIGLYIAVLVILLVIEQKILVGGWNGIIVGNLIASCYWVPFTFFHMDQLQRKHHAEQMEAHKKSYGVYRIVSNSLYGKSRWYFTHTKTKQHLETIDPIIAIEYFRDPEWEEGLWN